MRCFIDLHSYTAMLEELVGRTHTKYDFDTSATRSYTEPVNNHNKNLSDLEPIIEDLGALLLVDCSLDYFTNIFAVKRQLGSISTEEHEEVLTEKLSLLEQQMYGECRELLHALEQRKNDEYHFLSECM